MRSFTLIVLLICMGLKLRAQSEETLFVWEAITSLNFPLKKGWSMNTSIATRSVWLNVNTPSDNEFKGLLSFGEINQFTTYKVNPYLKLSAGYKYRWLEPSEGFGLEEHRFTEQVALIHRTQTVRMTSRGRVEQRIQNEILSHRIRYRFSIDTPLSGQTLDPKEFYFVASNEWLYQICSGSSNTFSNRLSAGLGYFFGITTKVQLNATYRSDLINIQSPDRLFIDTALYFNL